MKRYAPALLMALALGVVAFAGARYWRAQVDALPEPVCDLTAGPCEHRLDDGLRLRIELSPRPVPLMRPVRVRVETSGGRLDAIEGRITGLNMQMAPNRVRFERVAPGRWQGETILPVCSQRRMHWQLTLTLRGRETRRIADAFHTER